MLGCFQIDDEFKLRRGAAAEAVRLARTARVPRLCDTIGHYVYLFERLTAVFGARFYRFEHIVTYSSGKVAGKVGEDTCFAPRSPTDIWALCCALRTNDATEARHLRTIPRGSVSRRNPAKLLRLKQHRVPFFAAK